MKVETRNSKSERLFRFVIRKSSIVMLLVLLTNNVEALAQSTNTSNRLSYDSFRMISDRNIFNPNRAARSSGRTTTRSTRTARVEYLSLVGLMAYEKGIYAFFDGTSNDYKQAVRTGDRIGEYRVERVTVDQVQLVLGTNTFELKVGMQMRREDNGNWFVADSNDETRRKVASAPVRTRTRGDDSGAEAGEEFPEGQLPEIIVVEADSNGEPVQVEPGDTGGITDPVLLRLMQRRREMSQ
jgi:hypothetical protein